MNLAHYFDGINNNVENTDPHKVSKKVACCKQFTNKMNKLVSNNSIDMVDYTFMLNFLKTKGTIVDTQRYHKIYNNIINNDNIAQEDKNELNECCTILFEHLYSLFDSNINNINDIDSVKSGNLIKDIEEHNKNIFSFTNDQTNAIKNLCYFLYDSNVRIFGLYGYAGTGKTTTITKFVHYLLHKNYINSVVFTAPTNVAVNGIKSKFRYELDELIKYKFKNETIENENFDDMLDKLEEKGLKVNFMTIHKLLNYKNDFDIEGERIFIANDKTAVSDYDLVIIDECSMINFQMVIHLIEEANKYNILAKKTPKILFIGDPAQLPPVNENDGAIFSKKDSDFNFKLYQTAFTNNSKKDTNVNIADFDKNLLQTMETKFNTLKKHILDMKYVVLKQVMRSSDDKVIGICNEMRAAVLGEIPFPKFYKYKGPKVFLYKYDRTLPKTKSLWFKKAVEYFSSTDNKQHLSNIMLTWTNKQTDEYNNVMRKTIFKKDKLDKFEVGDILILTDFYNIKDTPKIQNKEKTQKTQKENSGIFHTSEQIKVTDIDHVTKSVEEFTENLVGVGKIKNMNDVKEKYIKTVKLINKNTARKYNVWKLYVHKLSEIVTDSIPETQQIYVVNDDSKDLLIKDRKYVAEKIKELRIYYRNMHKENLNTIDNKVIRPLWKELNNKLVDPFANVNVSFSISTHKSQSGTFYNVFVDVDDILKNPKTQEGMRCLYTGLTRTSNELHLLI